jgi:hypothetical protein
VKKLFLHSVKYIRGGKKEELIIVLKVQLDWPQAWHKISFHSDFFLSNAQILFSTININVHAEGSINALEAF